MLLITSLFGTKGKLEIDKKCGPLTQLLHCKISADIPRLPASAGLSLVATWFYWPTLVKSKISQTWFATRIGRAANRAACSSSFGTVITFIGATRAFLNTNASSVFNSPVGVVTRTRTNATALKLSWELSSNLCNSTLSKGPVK